MVNFAFFGTDEFSVTVLETLKKQGLLPSLIVTTPDKPKGRKMIMTPPPVKVWAGENGIEVIQPQKLKLSEVGLLGSSKSNFENLASEKFDFFLVASYGKIIPKDILEIPTHGTLNIHPSLLPKYRGPSPLETAILNGDDKTGVTIIKLDEEMDHGPILAQESFILKDNYNFEQLRDKTAELGGEMITKILPDYLTNKITPEPQDHDSAIFTKKLNKGDGYLDPKDSDLKNYRKILALNPWPGTYINHNQARLIIKQAHLEGDKLVYDRIVPAGKKEMSWDDFLRGLRPGK